MEGLFKYTLKTIDNESFINSNRIGISSFSRKRKLNFKNLIVLLMGFTRPGVQTELDLFFKALSQSSTSFSSLSKSAFTQARAKLRSTAFIELAKGQLSYFYRYAPHKRS